MAARLPSTQTVSFRRWTTRDGGEFLHNRYVLTDLGGVASRITSTPMGDGGAPARDRSRRQSPPSPGAKRRGATAHVSVESLSANRLRPLARRTERWVTDDVSGLSPPLRSG